MTTVSAPPAAVTISVQDPRVCRLVIRDAGLLPLLEEACSYYPRNFHRGWEFTTGRSDGRVRLLALDGAGGWVLPTGLAPRVAALCARAGAVVAWEKPPYQKPLVTARYTWSDAPGELRDYQTAAVEACLLFRRGVVKMATGSGKTEVFARVIAYLGRKSLVIVPTKDLLYQTADRLRERIPGADVQVVGDGHYRFSPEITVGLFPTLAKHRDKLSDELSNIGVLVSDEAQHSGSSSTWAGTLDACPAPFRFAFSATPYINSTRRVQFPDGRFRQVETGPDLVLEAMTGPLIAEYTPAQGIAAGVLVEPHVWLLRLPQQMPVDPRIGDWTTVYTHGIVNNGPRNDLLADTAVAAVAAGRQVVVLVQRVEHGERLGQLIRDRGVTAAFLFGGDAAAVRQQVLRGFREKSYAVLVSTTIYDEGIDIAQIAAVVMAGGGRSDHKTIQRVGRGMRPGGAAKLLIVDTLDVAHPWLRNHAAMRRKVYRDQNWQVEVLG